MYLYQYIAYQLIAARLGGEKRKLARENLTRVITKFMPPTKGVTEIWAELPDVLQQHQLESADNRLQEMGFTAWYKDDLYYLDIKSDLTRHFVIDLGMTMDQKSLENVKHVKKVITDLLMKEAELFQWDGRDNNFKG